jgi:hypothetical protein
MGSIIGRNYPVLLHPTYVIRVVGVEEEVSIHIMGFG